MPTAMLPTNIHGKNLDHPDLYPRLRFAFMEAGAGWLPYWAERMDEHYEMLRPQVPKLKRRPSEHIASGRVFVACDPDEKMLPQVLELVGEDLVIYASDYCHWDSRFPDSVRLAEDRSELSLEKKGKILGENALRFFGFKESELGQRAG